MPVVVFSSCLSLPTGDCHVCFQDLGMSQLDDWAVHHYPLNGPKRGGVWVEIVSYNNLFSRYTMILVRFYTLGGGQVTSAGGRIFSKFDFPPKKRIMSVFLPPENPWKKHAPRMNTDKKNHMKTHHWENTVESDLPAVLSGLPSHLCGNSWAGQGGENVNHHRKQGTSSRNLPYTSKWGRYVFFFSDLYMVFWKKYIYHGDKFVIFKSFFRGMVIIFWSKNNQQQSFFNEKTRLFAPNSKAKTQNHQFYLSWNYELFKVIFSYVKAFCWERSGQDIPCNDLISAYWSSTSLIGWRASGRLIGKH